MTLIIPKKLLLNNALRISEYGNDFFTCADGWSIPLIWTCDGNNNCGDFSDEEYCRKLRKYSNRLKILKTVEVEVAF